MKSLVVYASHKGNTRRVAEEIGATLASAGESSVLRVDEAPASIGADVDLLVIGGPTEGHGMVPEVRHYLARLEHRTLRGRAAAAFDTRLRWPKLLSGSAADGIARRLSDAGARLAAPQGSFIVSMEPSLEPGELERARAWAAELATLARPLLVS